VLIKIKKLEENNLAIQDMTLLQSLIMVQDVGLWSGNRRKMDIAECYLATPVQVSMPRSWLRMPNSFQAS
jgi:hypothetical protein